MTFIPKPPPPLHKRKYQDGDTVTIEDLRAAYMTAAKVASVDPVYLPIFIRMEHELESRAGQNSVLDRVRNIAKNGIQNEIQNGAHKQIHTL